jgi:DNA-binding protein HU-beta
MLNYKRVATRWGCFTGDADDPGEDPGFGLDVLPVAWRTGAPRSGRALQLARPDHDAKGNPVNKAQLIEAVTDKGGHHLTPTEAVESVLDAIVRAVVADEAVSVTGFGSITPHDRPARVAHNPQTGATVHVDATRIVRFRPGARFRDLVAGRAALPADGNSIKKAPKTPRP